MSVNIHHGPPGSYKTSGAVHEHFIGAAKQGRNIITNVRGLESELKIQKVINKEMKSSLLKKLSPKRLEETLANLQKFKITNIDTSSEEGKEKLRSFISWAPHNSFFLIDEINTIFPKEWTKTMFKKYDYVGGLDQATKDQRPVDIQTALEMHRHYNWDFTLTTPNITKVHSYFRDVAEVCYLHKNRKVIGLGGSYWEIMHTADTTENPSLTT